MRVIFANGTSLHFTAYEMMVIVARGPSVTTFTGIVAALALFSVYSPLHEIKWYYQSIMWIVGVPLFAYLYISSVSFFEKLVRIFSLRFIPEPLVMLLSTAIITFILMPLAAALIGNPEPPMGLILEFIVYNFLMWEFAALLYFNFVVPQELHKLRNGKLPHAKEQGLDNKALQVRLGDQDYRVEDLIHVSAEDHYLRVVAIHGTSMVQGQISDFANSVSPEHGVLVHRSHWVGLRHVSEVKKSNGRVLLQLSNNTHVPVARSKKSAILNEAAVTGTRKP
jgi:DNA-binding LytR/AlgR family response regulator